FLILAPTSSVLPIADLAFEHRMYLPLAAVVVVAVVGGYLLLEALFARHGTPQGTSSQEAGKETLRRPAEMDRVVGVGLIFVSVTSHRNENYRSPLVMWRNVVAERPDNPRARNNLGAALEKQGRLDEAIPQYLEALRINPHYAEAHRNLGFVRLGQRQNQE